MSNNQNMNSMDLGKIEPDAIVVTSSGNFPTEIIANMLLYSVAISCKRIADIQQRFEKNLKKDTKYD